MGLVELAHGDSGALQAFAHGAGEGDGLGIVAVNADRVDATGDVLAGFSDDRAGLHHFGDAFRSVGGVMDHRAGFRAVIHDAAHAAKRITEMVQAGAIITESGKHIPSRIDTICVHGDNAEAVALARAVREGLQSAGIAVRQFD